jgi:hypothetical protein
MPLMSAARPTVWRRVRVLLLLPVFAAGSFLVAIVCGPVLGLCSAASIAAWYVPVVTIRTDLFLRHEKWAFVASVYVLATLLWSLIAPMTAALLGHTPVAATVAVAIGAGAALIGWVWPAQRRFNADLRRTREG